jgi:hypothetical protein
LCDIILSDSLQEVILDNLEEIETTFTIENTGEIDTLDLHGNCLTSFLLGHGEKIKKLLLYENNITTLICSKN